MDNHLEKNIVKTFNSDILYSEPPLCPTLPKLVNAFLLEDAQNNLKICKERLKIYEIFIKEKKM